MFGESMKEKRIVYNMDFQWRFHRGDVNFIEGNSHSDSYSKCKAGGVVGPAGISYSDEEWREIDLPHDFFSESEIAANNLISHGYRHRCNGWYRKTFKLDSSLKGKHLLLCFEGTSVNAEFYFNGSLMERSFSAYTESVFEITDRAYFDEHVNTLAVHIKGLETEGWWYEGAGIYRHVKLYAKDKLHIAHNGVWAKPVLDTDGKNDWTVQLETTIENSDYKEDKPGKVLAELFDGNRLVAKSISEQVICEYCNNTVIKQSFAVIDPERWDVDFPKLYSLRVTLTSNDGGTDEENVRIGFRTFYMDKDKGFFLNGRKLLIKGTCNHQDHAGVGVAVPDAVQYYRIQRLKELGSNAYRCSHNLPAKEILDACDEFGLIVMDENRRFESRREVLEYLDIMVKRDRNHPSVIFYSLFNEEPLQNTEEGAQIYRHMRAHVEHLDNTRLFTGAINGSMEGAGLEMDVTGINYNLSSVEQMRKFHPEQPLIGAENNSAVTTRGCYKSDYEVNHVLSNYDEETVPWGQTIHETWDFLRKHEYFSGIFVWTGFDYRGEPTPFGWPSVSSQFGIMDTCGFPKDSFYFNKACFTNTPMVHLLPHWNWNRGDTVRVMAVTNCEEAELFVNGISNGKKIVDVCKIPEWIVEYVPGNISVKAYQKGVCVAEEKHETTGAPKKIKMCPVNKKIKNNGHDTAIINVCVTDEEGRIVPNATNHLSFEVIGDGIVRGVGNGDPNSHESDVLPERNLFAGWCQLLVMSKLGGKAIKIIASGEGLEKDEFELEMMEVEQTNCILWARNYDIHGFTKSDVFLERPDPLIKLADNNMNSFQPIGFNDSTYQLDFYKGWRTYRAMINVNPGVEYQLLLPKVYADQIEIYVNKKLCYALNKSIHHEKVECFIHADIDKTIELRILIYVEAASAVGGGIAEAVRLLSCVSWDRVHPNQMGSTMMAKEFLKHCDFDYKR